MKIKGIEVINGEFEKRTLWDLGKPIEVYTTPKNCEIKILL